MNKTIKQFIALAGFVFVSVLIATSFFIGMLFWRGQGAVQSVQAANLPANRSNLNAAAALPVQPALTATPLPGYPAQANPGQSGGMMMRGWGNGWMRGGMMGGWQYNNGAQTTPPPGGYWGCGMNGSGMMGGWGMMNGWGYPGGQGVVIPQPTLNSNLSFQQVILPIFKDDCIVCHGGTAGLYLDSYSHLIQGGRSGAVIIPGNPQSSLLIQYVAASYMPFRGQKLTDAEIQALVNWVAAGAKDN